MNVNSEHVGWKDDKMEAIFDLYKHLSCLGTRNSIVLEVYVLNPVYPQNSREQTQILWQPQENFHKVQEVSLLASRMDRET